MPTGYTACVADGEVTDLRTFALRCARGMGALITMRDEPWDAPIPERLQPSTKYYSEHLTEARRELAEVAALTPAECDTRAAADHADEMRRHEERLADKRARRGRYDAMIAQVEGWSTEAEGIRSFMLEQLRSGQDFDCDERYVSEPAPALSGDEWRAARMKTLAKDIGHHEEQIAAEVARTDNRNRWIAALRASLPQAEPVE